LNQRKSNYQSTQVYLCLRRDKFDLYSNDSNSIVVESDQMLVVVVDVVDENDYVDRNSLFDVMTIPDDIDLRIDRKMIGQRHYHLLHDYYDHDLIAVDDDSDWDYYYYYCVAW